jgi:hypothetical protein
MVGQTEGAIVTYNRNLASAACYRKRVSTFSRRQCDSVHDGSADRKLPCGWRLQQNRARAVSFLLGNMGRKAWIDSTYWKKSKRQGSFKFQFRSPRC